MPDTAMDGVEGRCVRWFMMDQPLAENTLCSIAEKAGSVNVPAFYLFFIVFS